ncbi:hypothetical protein D1AOALGA4SA_12114 [Olavius algarvensis Delta 1 endosymbiont]|nr:hypothetical protein D1AOALGA4SA_12114 [Olavius algarvensis Delta 1 endosymbiont]
MIPCSIFDIRFFRVSFPIRPVVRLASDWADTCHTAPRSQPPWK